MLTDLISELNIEKQDPENECQRSIKDKTKRQFPQINKVIICKLGKTKKSRKCMNESVDRFVFLYSEYFIMK